MEGFSIVIPTYTAAAELDLCLRSIARNSTLDNEVRVYVDPVDGVAPDGEILKVLSDHGAAHTVNDRRLGPYGSWNRGARETSRDTVCFVTDDQYFAPDWDGQIARHAAKYPVLTSHLVESGIIRPYPTNLMRDFGRYAEEFDEAGFLDFVEMCAEDRVSSGGFYSPTVMRRDLFLKLGGWPDRKPFPHPNDWLFRAKLHRAGLEYHRVCSSFSYHFQGSSADGEKPATLHFQRPDTPRKPESRRHKLLRKARGGPRWSLVKAGLLKPRPTKVAGYAWPKKADLALIYEYCVGRGVELGPGSNRIANINTVSVDMVDDFKGRTYPPPDILGNVYELSCFETGSRDFIINAHLVEHLIDPIRALTEWKRVLCPGGCMYLIVPDKNTTASPIDRSARETTIEKLIDRNERNLIETNDENPETSTRGEFTGGGFDPKGIVGQRHFNYWTTESFTELIRHLGLDVVKVVEPRDKDVGLDAGRSFDDFTVIARVPETGD